MRTAGSSRPAPPQSRKKKRGHASCAKSKQQSNDEQWAKKRPRLVEALEVKRQPSAVGRGLFVRKSFKAGFERGDAIGEYVGERILEDEYQTRMEQYIAQKEFNYFVDVVTESGDVTGLYIDATKKGNWTRFTNNSHDPNAQFEPVVIENTYHIFLVAIKKIRPGEEVTIDYGAEYRSPDQKFVECTCTAKYCSGVIGVQLEKAFIRKLLLEDIHYKDDDLNVLCAENRLLETQNQQYKKQITLFRAALNQKISEVMDQIFIPLNDHRPDEVRESNNSIVQGLHQELAVTSGNDMTIGPPELIPYSDSPLAAPVRKHSRSSPRLSMNGKRPSEAASTRKDEEPGSSEITPPQKKQRVRTHLSVQNLANVTIESTASDYPNVHSPDTRPQDRARRTNTPVPVVQHSAPSSSTASVSISSRSSTHSDSDSDIIEVTPVFQTRALPAPSASKPVAIVPLTPPQKPDLTVAILQSKPGPSGSGNLIQSAIDWYKEVCNLWSNSKAGDPDLPRCPVHRKEPLNKMREFRQHFFVKHAGAANQYKRQLEANGDSLTEPEKKLFQQTQTIQNQL